MLTAASTLYCRTTQTRRLRERLNFFIGVFAVTQASLIASHHALSKTRDLYAMCKPRITALIVFTSLAGALVASDQPVPLGILLSAVVGIALVSSAAAIVNGLLEIRRDAKMDRTRWRPLASGRVAAHQAATFAGLLGALGLAILYVGTNALTMWLAIASFLGYAVVYTLLLKPHTSQNIVIGGAPGAMPPMMGWSAVTGNVAWEPFLLFLIIFAWTPPHFWSLALVYRDDYAKGGFPMLPVKRGIAFTQTRILSYSGLMALLSLLPYFWGFAGEIYFLAAVVLGGMFLRHSLLLYRRFSGTRSLALFKFSVAYLFWLFSALIVDHYLFVALM